MAQLLYPIGIQTFSKIREAGFVYVDKTEYIHRLVSTSQYVFLSRPRRFGKSLLLSTIESYFQGRRELFEGLAISNYQQDWTPCPVLYLDFTGTNYDSPDSLKIHLNHFLTGWERQFGIEKQDQSIGLRFKRVLEEAHAKTGERVVLLIDEYDKALLETVDRRDLQEQYRSDLRAFYSNLKSQDLHIRFAMLTGVTKFGHLSIFSDLNNLQDISLDEQYSGICGVTTDELHQYFHPGVEELARDWEITTDEAYEKLKQSYDGYHFSAKRREDVYNPFSLLNCLSKRMFGDYWFKTGTPTFLIKMIRDMGLPLQDLSQHQTYLTSLTDVSFDLGDPIPVLYQSGYLTIKDFDPEFKTVTLGFPNTEVENGFFNQLLPFYTSLKSNSAFEITRFVKDAREGRAEDFMQRMQSLFADFQYDAFDLRRLEQHYQDVLFILVKLMGLYTRIEYRTASGRIDMVIMTPGYIYVMEFKLDRTAEEALAQIDSKGYMLPFRADGRRFIKIGANFSTQLRGIDSWIIEEE